MTVGQVATPARRVSLSFVAAIVAVAFILGALAGVGLPRVLGNANHATGAVAPAIAGTHSLGVAVNNMSDAAERAFAAFAARSVPGVAVNNMSDAAERAFAAFAARSVPGVAVNNMSDAAERAFAALYRNAGH